MDEILEGANAEDNAPDEAVGVWLLDNFLEKFESRRRELGVTQHNNVVQSVFSSIDEIGKSTFRAVLPY